MKKFLIIKASTTSESENVDIFIVEVTPQFIERIKSLHSAVKSLSLGGFAHIQVYDTYGNFFSDGEEQFDFSRDQISIFVDEYNKGDVHDPENTMDCPDIQVKVSGFRFISHGKYDGTIECWSELVSWNIFD